VLTVIRHCNIFWGNWIQSTSYFFNNCCNCNLPSIPYTCYMSRPILSSLLMYDEYKLWRWADWQQRYLNWEINILNFILLLQTIFVPAFCFVDPWFKFLPAALPLVSSWPWRLDFSRPACVHTYRSSVLSHLLLMTESPRNEETSFTPRTALGPTQPPSQWVPGALSLGVKRSGREADHSSQSSAEVKEWVGLYLHYPNTPSWRGAQLKHRDFNFYLLHFLSKPYTGFSSAANTRNDVSGFIHGMAAW
jgi:hypothetical protein